jgi:23S rRNA (pseudouridine1915-N3)-methyltransferase
LSIINIITIGKWKRSAEKQLFDDYIGRGTWQINLHELAGLPKIDASARRGRETELLIAQSKDKAFCSGAGAFFALDERGRNYSSVEFADKLEQSFAVGIRKICFLIGGDVGMDFELLKQSGAQLFSFGQMTWPHLMVRLLLAEQLYRAQTIITNHPYHRQ